MRKIATVWISICYIMPGLSLIKHQPVMLLIINEIPVSFPQVSYPKYIVKICYSPCHSHTVRDIACCHSVEYRHFEYPYGADPS